MFVMKWLKTIKLIRFIFYFLKNLTTPLTFFFYLSEFMFYCKVLYYHRYRFIQVLFII